VFCAKQALLAAHEDMRLTSAPFPPPASPFHPISQRPSELSFSALQVTIATLGAVFGGSLQMACSTNPSCYFGFEQSSQPHNELIFTEQQLPEYARILHRKCFIAYANSVANPFS
jgi:hypothetical protein